MAFALSIKLAVAQLVFPQFNIEEVLTSSGERTGVYKCTIRKPSCDHVLREKGLTALCTVLVEELVRLCGLRSPDEPAKGIPDESAKGIPGLGPK